MIKTRQLPSGFSQETVALEAIWRLHNSAVTECERVTLSTARKILPPLASSGGCGPRD